MGNMYKNMETWNPLGGECLHKCSYCYRNKLKKRFPSINKKYSGEYRIDFDNFSKLSKHKKPLFVCSMIDLFEEHVPTDFILQILEKCRSVDNTYFFQTRNTYRLWQFTEAVLFPKKSILCTTIESNRKFKGTEAPDVVERAFWFGKIVGFKNQLTIEPIMDFDWTFFLGLIDGAKVKQINIGADTGNNNLDEPLNLKLHNLIYKLRSADYKVVLKDNLKRIF